jgi:uncharacterized membrane protein
MLLSVPIFHLNWMSKSESGIKTMSLLITGLALWSLLHFLPAAEIGLRQSLISKIGENPYKGVFTLLMFLSIYLMVVGWKSTIPELAYAPPAWGRHATSLLVLIAFVLLLAPYSSNNFKRILRHPQLTGIACWGVGHLLSNGEMRSIVLFAGMTLWAFIEILLINRRDGASSKPESVPVKNDIILIFAGGVIYAMFLFAHQWLFGVSPMA